MNARMRIALTMALALGALAAMLLMACGGGGGDEDTPEPATEEATATATDEPTESPTDTPEPTATPYNGAVARIVIPKFGVDSLIEPIGLIPNTNQLDTPANPLNTGWYDIYDKPGWGGNAVFSAHYNNLIGGSFVDGPFRRLSEMVEGDEVVVVMEDGSQYRYVVMSYARYDESNIPMGELIDAPMKPATQEWITLITCGGDTTVLDENGVGEFLQRDVVVAVKLGS